MPPARSCFLATLVLAALVLVGGFVAPALADPVAGFVRADGKRLVTPDGRTFLVKGINFGHWLLPEGYMFRFNRNTEAPDQIRRVFARLLGPDGAAEFWSRFRDEFISEADIRFLAKTGFNTVRVPLDYRLFVTAPNDGSREPTIGGPGFALIDRLVGWCRDAGIRIVLDMHAAPGGQAGTSHDGGTGLPLLWYSRANQDLTEQLWRAIAERYANEPAVMGYDLLNEPIAPHHDTKYLEPRLEPYLKRLTAAVRSVAPHQVIFIEGSRWGTTWHALGKPFDDNLAYTYHSYWASPRRNTIQPQLNFRDRWKVPILITETGEGDDGWISRFRTMHEQYGIGWVVWPYKNLDQTTAVAAIKRPPDWNAIVAYADRFAADRNAPLPPKDVIARAFADYLTGMRFENLVVQKSYLAALGLTAPAP